MEKFSDRILFLGKKIVFFCFGAILFYLFFLSLFSTCYMAYTDEHIFYLRDFAIPICLGLGFVVSVLAFFRDRQEKKAASGKSLLQFLDTYEKPIFGIVTCLVAIFWAMMIYRLQAEPVYDQLWVYQGDCRFLQGDTTDWQSGNYFSIYDFQNSMALMMLPLAALWGMKGLVLFQYLNIPVILLAILALSRIADLYFGRRVRQFTYLGLLFFLPLWSQVTTVYGTWFSFAFSLWAIYLTILYERRGKTAYLVTGLICIIFGVLWKNNAEIFMLTMAIMLVMDGIRRRKALSLAAALLTVLLPLLSLYGSVSLMQCLTGADTPAGIPVSAWICMGLSDSSIAPGWFNDYHMNLYHRFGLDRELLSSGIRQDLREQLAFLGSNPDYTLRFFPRKLASMWSEPSFQAFTQITNRVHTNPLAYWMKECLYNGGRGHMILYLFFDVLQSMVYFGLVQYFVFTRISRDLQQGHLAVAIIGGFLFHLISEAQGVYVLPYFLCTFPYAVEGYRRGSLALLRRWRQAGQGRRIRSFLMGASRSGSGRIALILAGLVLLITLLPDPITSALIKLRYQEQDYLWYCQTQLEWQAEDYVKS